MKQRSKLLGITLGDDILDLTSKAKAIKAKINNWDQSKLKVSSQQKKQIRIKKHPLKLEEKTVNHTSSNKLISKIYKEFLQLKVKPNNLDKGHKYIFFPKKTYKWAIGT